MIKIKLLALPLALLLMLGACSDNDSAEKAEESVTPSETEAAAETVADAPKTDLDLPAADEVVVVVNGEEIHGTVYNSVARQLESSLATQGKKATDPEVAGQVKEQAITVIVGNKLIIQDAIKKGHEVDAELVEQRLEELKNQFENEEQMTIALQRTGFTLDDMKQQLREQVIYESYLAEDIEGAEVTEEELKESYQGYVDSTEGESPEFEEMKPMIQKSLEERNVQQAVYERIEELREAADIDVKI
ncbi:SurA N-terminal domain-containing protein [Planococcus sp. CAU13]|uniref:SurA N-terminal domain-containing protein n=1 Tax=Planococcus sp. CAU13 TaxID=1541197 RepID=UPI00052FE16B|nr:SurA N-terminal domain-containing protein [Planococcus sp. CAU13]